MVFYKLSQSTPWHYYLGISMSAQPKEAEKDQENIYYSKTDRPQTKVVKESKVNLNDLVSRLKVEKKKEQKHNLILSVAALSAVAVFGIILTL